MSQPFHFGPANRALLGFYHPTTGKMSRGAGVVLCNPIGDDSIRSHRSFRHLAERLAAAGYAVLRFDFHGTGDSAGHEYAPDRVKMWLEDIALAIDALRSRSGVEKISLVGLRLGATLAMVAASRRRNIDSLVLWNPHLSGKEFVSESTRMHKVQAVLNPDAFARSTTGGAEALGFFLSDATIADLEKVDLLTVEKAPALRVLILGEKTQAPPVMERLHALGAAAHYRHQTHKFLIMIPHQSTLPVQSLSEIVEWLNTIYKPVKKTGNPVERPCEINQEWFKKEFNEEPLVFGASRKLFGILTSPPESAQNSTKGDRPAIILLNAGTSHRMGPHRLYVKMARRWADLGFPVLRLDIAGIGDSAAEPGIDENQCYPPSALADAQAAMDLVQDRMSVNRFVVAGLCSGGDNAFQAGFHDPRITGAVIINPLTFQVLDQQRVESHGRSQARQSLLLEKNKWLKLLRGKVNVTAVIRTLVSDSAGNLLNWVQPAEKTVPECLRQIVKRGGNVFLVASENDPGTVYVDTHFGKEMRALEPLDGFRRVCLKGTDHTFTSLDSQRRVIETITAHFQEKFPQTERSHAHTRARLARTEGAAPALHP